MTEINPKIFKAYDIRGIYPDELDTETAFGIAKAFIYFLVNDQNKTNKLKIALGQDMRVHSPFFARQIMKGLTESGAGVVDLGEVATPAFYHAVAFHDLDGGIMVTASHNPKQYNGFKLVREKAIPISAGSGMDKIKQYTLEGKNIEAGGEGEVTKSDNLTREYVERDLSYVNLGKIDKFTIAADTANSMGATFLDILFKKINAESIKLNWDLNGNMPIHEANPLNYETLQQLQEMIRNENADLGLATDGDGDRIAFLDEKGEVIPPDVITGLVARMILQKKPGAKIGYDLRMSKTVREMIEEAGGEAVETMVGHSNIKSLMRENDIIFSGELSMHYYFQENYYYESPVFVTAVLLQIRSMSDKPFSEIWQKYNKYFHSGEVNFEVGDKQKVMDELEQQYSSGNISHLDGLKIDLGSWWFSARPSNTEPYLRLNLEAESKEIMQQKLDEVKNIISN